MRQALPSVVSRQNTDTKKSPPEGGQMGRGIEKRMLNGDGVYSFQPPRLLSRNFGRLMANRMQVRFGCRVLSVPALSSEHHSRSGLICRQFAFVNSSACLPRVSPSAAVLVPLVNKPVHGLFCRRECDPDAAVLDHDGFFPTGRKHVRLPHRLMTTTTNTVGAVSFQASNTSRRESSMIGGGR